MQQKNPPNLHSSPSGRPACLFFFAPAARRQSKQQASWARSTSLPVSWSTDSLVIPHTRVRIGQSDLGRFHLRGDASGGARDGGGTHHEQRYYAGGVRGEARRLTSRAQGRRTPTQWPRKAAYPCSLRYSRQEGLSNRAQRQPGRSGLWRLGMRVRLAMLEP